MAVAYRSHAGGNIGNSTTLSVSAAPSGVANGDFLVLWVATNAVHTLGAGGPSAAGWTQIGSTQVHGSDTSMSCWYKIASSEPADYTFTTTFTANMAQSYLIAAYSGVDGSTPLDGVTPVQENSGNTETAPAVTIVPATNGAMILFLLGSDPGVDPVVFAANTPVGSTARATQQSALSTFVGLIEYLQATAGSETITGSASGDAYCETAIALRPAAGGATPKPKSLGLMGCG
jgi:hypothetical protein